jgi:hypothetical protein
MRGNVYEITEAVVNACIGGYIPDCQLTARSRLKVSPGNVP